MSLVCSPPVTLIFVHGSLCLLNAWLPLIYASHPYTCVEPRSLSTMYFCRVISYKPSVNTYVIRRLRSKAPQRSGPPNKQASKLQGSKPSCDYFLEEIRSHSDTLRPARDRRRDSASSIPWTWSQFSTSTSPKGTSGELWATKAEVATIY